MDLKHFRWWSTNGGKYFFEVCGDKKPTEYDRKFNSLISNTASTFYLGDNRTIPPQFIKNRGHTRMWYSYMIGSHGF